VEIQYEQCNKWEDSSLPNGAKAIIQTVIESSAPTNTKDLIKGIKLFQADPLMLNEHQLSELKNLAIDIVNQAKSIGAIV